VTLRPNTPTDTRATTQEIERPVTFTDVRASMLADLEKLHAYVFSIAHRAGHSPADVERFGLALGALDAALDVLDDL
jgi:hypothetical protein